MGCDSMRTRISLKEATDSEYVKTLLKEFSEILVFDDNQLAYTINNNTSDKVKYYLSKVGKEVFVEYYKVFRDRDNPERYLPAKFTKSSRKLRTYTGLKLFELNLNIDALKQVVYSKRLDIRIINKAKVLLAEEGIIIINSFSINTLIKNVVPRLIIDGHMDGELDQFLHREYSNKILGLQYPLLQEVFMYYDKDDLRLDFNRYPRYYKKTVQHSNREFLLCSHWDTKRHSKKVRTWLIQTCINAVNNDVYKRTFENLFGEYLMYFDDEIINKIKNGCI